MADRLQLVTRRKLQEGLGWYLRVSGAGGSLSSVQLGT